MNLRSLRNLRSKNKLLRHVSYKLRLMIFSLKSFQIMFRVSGEGRKGTKKHWIKNSKQF